MEHTSKVRGIVKGLRESYDDKSLINVEVEFPPKEPPKKPKKGEGPIAAYKPTQNYPVSKAMSEDLAVGDPVECETTIRHFGRRHRGIHAKDTETKEN